MPNYSALIDPADFGLIADYLRSSTTPIDYLLHVKSLDGLAPLAEALDQQRVDLPPWRFPEVVERGLAEGSILISSRHRLDLPDRRTWIDSRAIPRQADCQVIYSPPFYLVHTPGLFEGTLVRQDTRQKRGPNNRSTPKARVKF